MATVKSERRKIDISEMPSDIPDFDNELEPKDYIIKNWIVSSVRLNKIKENDILPKKSEISRYLGVSSGSVQNAIRYIEDEGLLKSKQKLGTMIANNSNSVSSFAKSTTKRDKAIIAIKKTIIKNNYKTGRPIPSTRKMSEYIGVSQNTVRLAYEYLCAAGILESLQMRGNDSNWYLRKFPQLSSKEVKQIETLDSDTLVDKTTDILKNYLSSNFNIGDKIPSHEFFANKLKVSVKTINDSIKRLVQERIIVTKRGRYGSILAQDPLSPVFEDLKENSIFTKDKNSEFYFYQKIETKLIDYINKNYNAGDKLPAMTQLAKLFKVSTNTVRKSLISLELQGCITFARGRFGGTFIVQKPENLQNEQYKWLIINPDFI